MLRWRRVTFVGVAKIVEKVLTSVNAIGRKEKSDNKLALEKEEVKADSSTSSSLGAQSEKAHIDKDSSPKGSIIV